MRLTAAEALRRAGWHAGRHVQVASLLSGLEKSGYRAWPALISVVGEYAGLEVHGQRHQEPLWIDPLRADGILFSEWVDEYARRAGCDLVPIGGYSHLTILYGTNGEYYGGFDDYFERLGRTIEEVVHCLLIERPPD